MYNCTVLQNLNQKPQVLDEQCGKETVLRHMPQVIFSKGGIYLREIQEEATEIGQNCWNLTPGKKKIYPERENQRVSTGHTGTLWAAGLGALT